VPIHTSTLNAWAADAKQAGSVDVVVMLNVLEHVPDPALVLAQCRTILRPGGLAVIRVPNDFTEIQQAAQDTLKVKPWWIAAPDHINYFNFDTLKAFLGNCGQETLFATSDFPMELFLMLGENYVSNPSLGGVLHEKRVKLELDMPAALRRKLYGALASVGVGRNVLSYSRKLG
jgi:SAM-dependent methyltransferase